MNPPRLKQVYSALGRVSARSERDYRIVNGYIEALEELLNRADAEDFFGTQGWRYELGLD